jgi:acetoin utilization protein AcuB
MSALTRLAATSPNPPRDITAILVSAVISRDVLVVDPQDPVVEVWQRMQDVATELAVVHDATRVVAVVSQHTLAVRWPAGGPGEMRRLRVRDVIDLGTPTLTADATVHEAADLITRFDLEGVPVVAARGELLGLVTLTELVRLLAGDPEASAAPTTLIPSGMEADRGP